MKTTTIDHGTLKGWRQHTRHRVPQCDACLAARRADRVATDRARASKAQKEWNGGLANKAPVRPTLPLTRVCTARTDCGTTTPTPSLVPVAVEDSREPRRWYCPGPCAAHGQALAEIRTIGAAA